MRSGSPADTHERQWPHLHRNPDRLPRELNTAQREELARDVTLELMDDRFAYTTAVHVPLAKDNIDQPSEVTIDRAGAKLWTGHMRLRETGSDRVLAVAMGPALRAGTRLLGNPICSDTAHHWHNCRGICARSWVSLELKMSRLSGPRVRTYRRLLSMLYTIAKRPLKHS
jgi:hypothetical protein